MSAKRTCSIEGCERRHYGRGWCDMHYQRWRKHGDPLWAPPTPSARFWENVDLEGPDGCWLWTGTTNGVGYGQLWVEGRRVYAHRFSYELLVGLIPAGLQLDHLCRVRHCVRPDHLEPVTRRENILRGEAPSARCAAKTHCPAGHEYSPENTYVYRGARQCRACRYAYQVAYRASTHTGGH